MRDDETMKAGIPGRAPPSSQDVVNGEEAGPRPVPDEKHVTGAGAAAPKAGQGTSRGA